MKVSVIIPFFNHAAWLIEAVNSVEQQTFADWEILLVDDGSEIAESGIAKQLADNKKIFYLQHKNHSNLGVSASRNVAIKHASGDFIAFLDADDKWLPQKLSNQLQLFSSNPEAAMIVESSIFWHSWQNNAEQDYNVCIGVEPNKCYAPLALSKALYPIGNGTPPCPSGVIVKTAAIRRNGAFDESFIGPQQLYEDQVFLAKMYLHENVFVSGSANHFYRKRPGSITETANDQETYRTARLFFLDWLFNYCAEDNINSSTMLSLIANARDEMKE